MKQELGYTRYELQGVKYPTIIIVSKQHESHTRIQNPETWRLRIERARMKGGEQ